MLPNNIAVYCDQDTAGGGWTLVLNQLHPDDDFAGSVSPFRDTNVGSPSTETLYSRDWSQIIAPATNDEWLLKSQGTSQWVRFVQTASWCPGTAANWLFSGSCHGGSSHLQYTHGKIYGMSFLAREKYGMN